MEKLDELGALERLQARVIALTEALRCLAGLDDGFRGALHGMVRELPDRQLYIALGSKFLEQVTLDLNQIANPPTDPAKDMSLRL